MTLEDPFFVVKDEVFKTLNQARGLYLRWLDLQEEKTSITSKEELEWTTTELKNAIRSIEWDLEDLQDTISIVERNPSKFKLDNKEFTLRRQFIDTTSDEVKLMKDKMMRIKDSKFNQRQPLIDSGQIVRAPAHSTTKYSKLENNDYDDSPAKRNNFLNETFQQQDRMQHLQDEQLEAISDTLGTLKNVSRQIGIEIDEQAEMLDDFGNEMDSTQSRIDTTVKKVAKVLRMTNDRRQWTAIFILSTFLIILIILFIIF